MCNFCVQSKRCQRQQKVWGVRKTPAAAGSAGGVEKTEKSLENAAYQALYLPNKVNIQRNN